MMKIKEYISEIEKQEKFKEWKKRHKESYLAHVFFDGSSFEAGYYNKDDSITTVKINDSNIEIDEEKEIFKKDKKAVKRLDISGVNADYDEAERAAKKLQQENYSGHEPIKVICVLQNIDAGQVYNFTFITQTFQTLNIKVDSKTKKIIEHRLYSLMDIGSVMQKKSVAG